MDIGLLQSGAARNRQSGQVEGRICTKDYWAGQPVSAEGAPGDGHGEDDGAVLLSRD